MGFDSYLSRLADSNEFAKEFFKKPKKIKQKKRFYFSNGLMSLPYSHSCLEDLRKEKQKYRAIHKTIQDKKYDFLKQESNAIDHNPRMHVLKQIFAQSQCFIF